MSFPLTFHTPAKIKGVELGWNKKFLWKCRGKSKVKRPYTYWSSDDGLLRVHSPLYSLKIRRVAETQDTLVLYLVIVWWHSPLVRWLPETLGTLFHLGWQSPTRWLLKCFYNVPRGFQLQLHLGREPSISRAFRLKKYFTGFRNLIFVFLINSNMLEYNLIYVSWVVGYMFCSTVYSS